MLYPSAVSALKKKVIVQRTRTPRLQYLVVPQSFWYLPQIETIDKSGMSAVSS